MLSLNQATWETFIASQCDPSQRSCRQPYVYPATHVHEQQLHLVFSDPPPDALPRPEPERQGAEPRPPSSLAPLSAFAPPARVKA